MLGNVVRLTLGPSGRTVLLSRGSRTPTSTRDGATVAGAIEAENRLVNLGVRLLQEVALRTGEQAGDGTTTATVLGQAIYREGNRLVAAGHDPRALERGIEKGTAKVLEALRGSSRAVRSQQEVVRVAELASNGDTVLGGLVAEALRRVGGDGAVTIEEGRGVECKLEVSDGMRVMQGYISPYFVTEPSRMEVCFEDALVLVLQRRLSVMYDLVPLLELVAHVGRPLLLVAEDVDADALTTLVVNKIRAGLRLCAVKAHGFGDEQRAFLEDLALLTGATILEDERGGTLAKVTLGQLGSARRVTVDRASTTLVGGGGAPAQVEARLAQLRAQRDEAPFGYERERLTARLARLSAGVAVLTVGGATDFEVRERKARAEDALNATRAALEEGVSPGGGVAYLRCQEVLDTLVVPEEERWGVDVLRRALEEPARRIALNAGFDGGIVVEQVLQSANRSWGFNAAKGTYEDLLAEGVLDPTKVLRVALSNASSLASMMLTCEVLITSGGPSEEDEEGASNGLH